jgi:hypothetical protein
MVSNGKGREDNTKGKKENPFTESTFAVESVGSLERKKGDDEGSREIHRVRIISMRVRICDPDNLVGGQKHLIDALRLARVIPEDDPQSITLQVCQRKVKSYKEEETWVEVTR